MVVILVGDSHDWRVNPRGLILEPKTMESATREWSDAPVKRRHFPLFKGALDYSSLWRWRAAVLRSHNREFRLLVLVRFDKPNYKAWLMVNTSEGWAMVARLESHAHSGLHCHAECGDDSLTVGEIAPASMRSLPHWRSYHRRAHLRYSETSWWELSLRFFRAQSGARGDLL